VLTKKDVTPPAAPCWCELRVCVHHSSSRHHAAALHAASSCCHMRGTCMVCADCWEHAYLTIMRPLLASSLLACPSERPHDLQGGTWSVHALRR
jgi:hypothetical protein